MEKRSKRKGFIVVKFTDMPFKHVENYVCVPREWVILRKLGKNRLIVIYPIDEDCQVTAGRAERREEPQDGWRLYGAEIIFKSSK